MSDSMDLSKDMEQQRSIYMLKKISKEPEQELSDEEYESSLLRDGLDSDDDEQDNTEWEEDE